MLIPADAFLKIVKKSGSTAGPFDFTTSPASAGCSITTAGGTGDCTFGIASGTAYSVTEAAQANWGITGTPVCVNATANGTYSNGTISAIKAASDTTVSCTFTNVRLTGAIEIIKQRTDTNTLLAGAHFRVDGSGDYITAANGTVCVGGLMLGNHTIDETQAPNGHSLPSPTSQVVNVTGAGTCATTQTPVTVYNDLLPGTIVIEKFGADGSSALNGATFTLHNDIAASSSYVPGTDTAVVPSKTCTGTLNGTCSLFSVPQGE